MTVDPTCLAQVVFRSRIGRVRGSQSKTGPGTAFLLSLAEDRARRSQNLAMLDGFANRADGSSLSVGQATRALDQARAERDVELMGGGGSGVASLLPNALIDDGRVGQLARAELARGVHRAGPSISPSRHGWVNLYFVVVNVERFIDERASERYPARPSVNFVYVDDVDATFGRALAMGSRSILEPTEPHESARLDSRHGLRSVA